ncbi:hypothetical protein N7495_002028 [Penicillium taxi]|uniref:uncharacterized protein n=1 Tax=Penicillium taxi TaxID=168475 RepID=UPI0025459D7A|nr:uncharacterized protein N7495_002028 [Penicillium taxi]KAJ5901500.1 hypothetical protein N7495_002028 [Penicillium taxi]
MTLLKISVSTWDPVSKHHEGYALFDLPAGTLGSCYRSGSEMHGAAVPTKKLSNGSFKKSVSEKIAAAGMFVQVFMITY